MVTRAKILSDTTIQLSVGVHAFLPNELVEISGYATQQHGAFAYFNEYQTIDAKLGDTATLDVQAELAGNSAAFQTGHDVTVFVRVSKVWVTVLAEGEDQHPGMQPNVAGVGTVWGRVKGAAGPEMYSPNTQEGNQPASATAGADQAAEGASSSPRAS